MPQKTAILLINLGTPKSPSVKHVRQYLTEFLNDPRVIDIHPLKRFFLVNGIIIPFRASKSAKIYKKLWTKEGSPLLLYGEKVKTLLQQSLGSEFHVELAMRYQEPSLNNVLEKMRKMNFTKIVLLPLFPQYASSSTGSAVEKAMSIIKKWWVIPEIEIISQFYDHPLFSKTFAEIAKKYSPESFDHVLFSFHGLPVRQLDKVYFDNKPCSDHNCEKEVNEENKFCYKATCYATARMIAAELNLSPEKYSVAFQSRLGKDPWVEPFSDIVIADMPKKGIKKLLVFSPAFIADCLETTIEIGDEYTHLFKENGGEKLQLVESLNDHPGFVQMLRELVLH
ncbi:MAG: ferrochelatase [Bacteroidota bacterium]